MKTVRQLLDSVLDELGDSCLYGSTQFTIEPCGPWRCLLYIEGQFKPIKVGQWW